MFWNNSIFFYFIDIKNVQWCQVLIEDWAHSDGWFSSDISWEPFCGILSDIDTISSDNIQDWGIKCEAWNCNQHRNDFLICSAALIPTKYTTTANSLTPPGRYLTTLTAPDWRFTVECNERILLTTSIG